MIKSKNRTERKHLKNIPIKVEIQKSLKKLPMPMRYLVIKIKENSMINTEKKVLSREAAVEEEWEVTYSLRCSEVEWVVEEDNQDPRKVKAYSMPSKSL
jgi:hypothetical protein